MIFDEFHERSLQADLGLALALDARRHLRPTCGSWSRPPPRRRPGGRPAGRRRRSGAGGHQREPRPPGGGPWAPRRPCDHVEPAAVAAVRQVLRTDPEGDVLVFLPGAGEIERAAGQLGEALGDGAPVDVHTAVRGAARRRPGRRARPRAAGAAQGGAGHRHRRDQPDGGGRLDRGRRRAGPAAGVRRHHRAHPAGDGAGAPVVGRPAGRPGRADRTGRGGAAVVQGRARRPAALTRARDPPGGPGRAWPWSWRCGAPTPPTCRSSIRRPPGRWTRPAACWWSSAPRRRRAPTAGGPGDGGAAAAPPAGPHGAGGGRAGPGVAGLPAGRDPGGPGRAAGPARRPPDDVGLRVALLDDPSARHPLADGRALRRAATGPGTWPGAWGPPAGGATPTSRAAAGPRLPRPHRPGPGRSGPVRAAGGDRGVGGDRRRAGPRAVPGRGRGRRPPQPGPHPPGRAPGPGPARRRGRRPGHRARPAGGTPTGTTSSPGSSGSWAGCGWASVERRPSPGLAATTALVDRVLPRSSPPCRGPTPPGRCRPGSRSCGRWPASRGPDLADAALRRTLDDWLAPLLAGATGRADLDRLDLPGCCGAWSRRWPATSTGWRPRR